MILFSTGLKEIQDWTRDSLKRRLKNSLASDWVPESRAHMLPLRDCYVQLKWEKKNRRALICETEPLTSLLELIKKMSSSNSTENASHSGKSVIVEGLILSVKLIQLGGP